MLSCLVPSVRFLYLVLFLFCLTKGLLSALGGRLCGTVEVEWLRNA